MGASNENRSQIVTIETEDDFSRSQFATLNEDGDNSRSQNATLKVKQGQNIKYLPYAFTENGIAMLSSVLRSPNVVLIKNIYHYDPDTTTKSRTRLCRSLGG